MKLMTLNTHSIVEENYNEKLKTFVDVIARTQPDIIALQEVNQTVGKLLEKNLQETGYIPCKGKRATVLQDNHALNIAKMLKARGIHYMWTWIPLKIGYQRYEEGLAILSKYPVERSEEFFISSCKDMDNWKTRKMLGIKVKGVWYYSVHMGWWDDEEEPFTDQWERTLAGIAKTTNQNENPLYFIMGDFNCPAQIRGEGYDHVKASGWYDTWEMAEKKDAGITVGKVIDGWRDRMETDADGMRIDYIWCNKEVHVKTSSVVFNGINYPVVSDHYGVEIEADIEKR